MRPTMNTRVKQIIVSIIAILVVTLIWYITFHGRITITSKEGVRSVSYSSIQSPDSVKKTNSQSITIDSGTYSVQVYLKNGASYITQVTVPHFFQSITITPKVAIHQLTALSNGTLALISNVTKSSVTSFDFDSGVRASSTSSVDTDTAVTKQPRELSLLNLPTRIGKESIGGVIPTVSGYTPVIYNVTTKNMSYFASVDASIDDIRISSQSSTNMLCIYNLTQQSIDNYTEGQAGTAPSPHIDLKNITPAKNDGQPIYSIEQNFLALLKGSDYISGGDGETIENKDDYTLSLVDNGATRTITLPGKYLIKNIILSPNHRNIAIISDYAVDIYDVASGDKTASFAVNSDRIIWTSDTSFLLTIPDEGIYSVATDRREAVNILPSSVINVSELSYIKNNVLYLTAFSRNDTYATAPNAYALDLKNIATDGNELIAKLPYQGDGFRISSLNNVLLIDTTQYVEDSGISTDVASQQRAKSYIRQNIKNFENYPIKMTYSSIDLRN